MVPLRANPAAARNCMPRHGCLTIMRRLPRWRGAAPIQRAIEAGDRATGVTIMQMDEGLDTGPIVDVQGVAIEERETARTLHDKLANAGATLIVEVLRRLDRDHRLPAISQAGEGGRPKIRRDDARMTGIETRGRSTGRCAPSTLRPARSRDSTARCSRSGGRNRSTASPGIRRAPCCPTATNWSWRAAAGRCACSNCSPQPASAWMRALSLRDDRSAG